MAFFICMHYKFSSRVIFSVVKSVASLVWFSLPVPLVSHIRLLPCSFYGLNSSNSVCDNTDRWPLTPLGPCSKCSRRDLRMILFPKRNCELIAQFLHYFCHVLWQKSRAFVFSFYFQFSTPCTSMTTSKSGVKILIPPFLAAWGCFSLSRFARRNSGTSWGKRSGNPAADWKLWNDYTSWGYKRQWSIWFYSPGRWTRRWSRFGPTRWQSSERQNQKQKMPPRNANTILVSSDRPWFHSAWAHRRQTPVK